MQSEQLVGGTYRAESRALVASTTLVGVESSRKTPLVVFACLLAVPPFGVQTMDGERSGGSDTYQRCQPCSSIFTVPAADVIENVEHICFRSKRHMRL